MGILSECMEATYGGISIEIEAKLGIKDHWTNGVARYRLIIDNEVVQEEIGHVGTTILRGFVNRQQGTRDQVQVIINQGWFRTNYRLNINGQEYSLSKKY